MGFPRASWNKSMRLPLTGRGEDTGAAEVDKTSSWSTTLN